MPAGAAPLVRPGVARARVAEAALALCAQVDALGCEVEAALAQDELSPLQPLLARRGLLLGQLSGLVAQLRGSAPSAHRPMGAEGAEAADPLMEAVLAALEQTAAETARLETLVATQVVALRGELDAMQRAAAAPAPYGASAPRREGHSTPAWGVGIPAQSPAPSRINYQG